jgi:hypothetical protein
MKESSKYISFRKIKIMELQKSDYLIKKKKESNPKSKKFKFKKIKKEMIQIK